MLVKDIVALACDFTCNENLSAKINSSQEFDENEQSQINCYVKCFNLVNNEIASEFIPIKKVEQFEVNDGKILLSKFTKKPYKILYIKNSLGRKVKFKIYQDHIVAFCKKAIVAYTILPDKLTISDQFDSFLPERIYAYGVAREYLFMQTKFDDADVFEERFKNSLELICRRMPHSKLPRRRWL